MNHITEIIPDMKDLPDWAVEAFHDGQFWNVTFKRITELEATLARVRNVHRYGAATSYKYVNAVDLDEALQDTPPKETT